MPSDASIRLLRSDLARLADCRSTDFFNLAAAAGLDPSKDFVGADLRGADLRGQDLRDFDLTDADISGAQIEGCLFDEARAPNRSSIDDPILADHQRSWKIVRESCRSDLPPDWATKLMHAIEETNDISQESRYLARLIHSATGFKTNVGLTRLLPMFRKAKPCPGWLRKFLLEFSVNLKARASRELIDELAGSGLMRPFDELEVLTSTAVRQEYDARRASAVTELGEKYSQSGEVKELLVSLSLSDESYEVRKVAIKSIPAGEFDEDELKTLLHGILEDDDDELVRAEALLKLAYFRRVDVEVLKLLFEYAFQGENAVRGAAILALEHEYGSSEDMNNIIASAIHNTLVKKADRAFLSSISVVRRLFKEWPNVDDYLFELIADDTDDLKVFYIFSAIVDCWPNSPHIPSLLDFCMFGKGRWVSRDAVIKYIDDKDTLKVKYKDRIFEVAREGMSQSQIRATFMAVDFLPDDSSKIKFLEEQYHRFDDPFNQSRFFNYVDKYFSKHAEGRKFLDMVREKNPSAATLKLGDYS